jgi:UDP-glucose 4-epimerase
VKAVVTGGAGFIGSHTAGGLVERGYDVTVVDDFRSGREQNLEPIASSVEVVRADIGRDDLSGVVGEGDYVFHLAGMADIVPSIEQPEEYFQANVTGTMNVLQAAKAGGASRFVYTASSSCYGIPDEYPTSEDAAIDTRYPYALTKYLGELLVRHWGEVYGLPYVSCRLFNVYGPRSRTTGTYGAVFGVFLAQKLAGRPYTVVGDGAQSRDFTYVSDVADVLIAAAESEAPRRARHDLGGRDADPRAARLGSEGSVRGRCPPDARAHRPVA